MSATLALGDEIYLFGGYSKISHKTMNDFHKFDTKTMSWSEIKVEGEIVPTARSGKYDE